MSNEEILTAVRSGAEKIDWVPSPYGYDSADGLWRLQRWEDDRWSLQMNGVRDDIAFFEPDDPLVLYITTSKRLRERRPLQPLDFVSPADNPNAVGLVTEVSVNGSRSASVHWIGAKGMRPYKSAWWDEEELAIVDSLPHILAKGLCHPFGSGENIAEDTFNIGEAEA